MSGAAQSKPDEISEHSYALVSSLYEQVVVLHPLGIPYGANKKVFAPYLSKALLHKFYVNKQCFADWRRRNPDPSLKPPIGMIEDGIFSGGDERAAPNSFHIERIEPGKDGSSRAYVRLAWDDPSNKPFIWHVAVIVLLENGRPVVDDVLYLKEKKGDVESSLSKSLSSGCRGTHWVGDVAHLR
jgi:hypothetical protein